MKDIEHFVFIQFYTVNQLVEQKKTFVFGFFEALKLRQDLVHAGFFGRSTKVGFGARLATLCQH